MAKGINLSIIASLNKFLLLLSYFSFFFKNISLFALFISLTIIILYYLTTFKVALLLYIIIKINLFKHYKRYSISSYTFLFLLLFILPILTSTLSFNKKASIINII